MCEHPPSFSSVRQLRWCTAACVAIEWCHGAFGAWAAAALVHAITVRCANPGAWCMGGSCPCACYHGALRKPWRLVHAPKQQPRGGLGHGRRGRAQKAQRVRRGPPLPRRPANLSRKAQRPSASARRWSGGARSRRRPASACACRHACALLRASTSALAPACLSPVWDASRASTLPMCASVLMSVLLSLCTRAAP